MSYECDLLNIMDIYEFYFCYEHHTDIRVAGSQGEKHNVKYEYFVKEQFAFFNHFIPSISFIRK